MDRKLEKVYEIPLKSGGKARVTISAEDAPSEAADAAELLRQYGEPRTRVLFRSIRLSGSAGG